MQTSVESARARGWEDAGHWREPQINPYTRGSEEWLAWAEGNDAAHLHARKTARAFNNSMRANIQE